MLDLQGAPYRELEQKGLGGTIHIVEKNNRKYVLKVSEQEQSVNEYVAQNLLKALGYGSIPTDLCKYNDGVYGVTEFVENIERIYPKLAAGFPHEIQQQLCELYILNGVLDNPDEGEFYLHNNELISLDYGETMVSAFCLNNNMDRSSDMDFMAYKTVMNLRARLGILYQIVGKEAGMAAFESLAKRFDKFQTEDIMDCLTPLDDAFKMNYSDIYANTFISIKHIIKKYTPETE